MAKKRVPGNGSRRLAGCIALTLVIAAITASAASASTFDNGDVFAGYAGFTYEVLDNAGNFKETIPSSGGAYGTGCAFNAAGNLYLTNFSGSIVVRDGNHPHDVIQSITDSASHGLGTPESVVFAQNGDFFTGGPFGRVLRYNAAGTFQQTYATADLGGLTGGSDWVDLSSDQHTVFYTDEGTTIGRFDTSGTGAQLSNFTTGLSTAYALRILPPGDGSGGVMVANGVDIKRLNSSGAVAQTYDVAGEDFWFALNLDPNGTSFWSANLFSGNIYRFNISTGAVEIGPINRSKGFVSGLCLKGELTAALPSNTPPPPPPAEPSGGGGCQGESPTINGTPGDDTIEGTDGDDVIRARGGNDAVFGRAGNDVICGNPGKDAIEGGAGDDRIRGNKSEDEVRGNAGNDELHGDHDNDEVFGASGNDFLQGGSGFDVCAGGPGKDEFRACQVQD